jgi:hypothetical protein
MVGAMMDQGERILAMGTPADKAQFTKTVLPAILKSLQDKKEGDDLAELRQAQADLLSEVREALLRPDEQRADPVREVPSDGGDSDIRKADDRPARRAAPARKADGKPAKVAPRGKARNSR